MGTSSPFQVVSSQDFEDLFAQLFDLVGHILGLSSVFGYFRKEAVMR